MGKITVLMGSPSHRLISSGLGSSLDTSKAIVNEQEQNGKFFMFVGVS